MKVLGVKQFHQKTFRLLDLSECKFADLLGKVPRHWIAVIKGFSGNGKTEFCIQLAKELCKHGKVLWLSYEQRHGFDLQEASVRNRMEEEVGNWLISDPLEGLKPGVSLLEDLDTYLKKRNSPEFIFIDSVDYTGFSFEDYCHLKNKYPKKSFFFLAHSSKSGKIIRNIGERIAFDGGMTIFVSNYIAYPEKNRFGGFAPYVVYEERARELNPLFFSKRTKNHPLTPASGGDAPKRKQTKKSKLNGEVHTNEPQL